MRKDETGPFDGELVAYLDDALAPAERQALDVRLAADAGLRERLAVLKGGDRPFRQAYGALLASAPTGRLEANLQAILARETMKAGVGPADRGIMSWRGLPAAAVAASLAVFTLGYAAGHGRLAWLPFAETASSDRTGSEAWRDVVASYLTLTTSQTLIAMRPPESQLRGELATALKKVGLAVDPARLDLPGRTLMKVELFHYNNAPLAQVTYLDEQNGPVSLCVTAKAGTVEAPELERRGAMNVAYWSSSTHAFMLVGLAPPEVLQDLVGDVAGRLGV